MRHQGTPVYMARAVVKGHAVQEDQLFLLADLPHLRSPALTAYQTILPERLNQFPQPATDQQEYVCCLDQSDRENVNTDSKWTHNLQHDAESSFWLLTWWAIHIRAPDTGSSGPPSLVPTQPWDYLTSIDIDSKEDERDRFLARMIAGSLEWIDPYYAQLHPLFKRMATQVRGDLHWISKAGSVPDYMREPDVMHEALQRIILEFLMDNQDQPFMHQARHPDFRVAPQRHLDVSNSRDSRPGSGKSKGSSR